MCNAAWSRAQRFNNQEVLWSYLACSSPIVYYDYYPLSYHDTVDCKVHYYENFLSKFFETHQRFFNCGVLIVNL